MRVTSAVLNAVIHELRVLLGERASTSASVLANRSRDASYHKPRPPDAVCLPHSTIEVAEIAKICAAHSTPIIPFGTGTGVEGNAIALHGGICIDLSQMKDVLAVNPSDLDCTVQAGVTRKQLNEHLRDTGLFFPIDPGADASIGGMASTRASGTNAVRYGTMLENVLGLSVVLPNGRIIRTSNRARKSSAGYDLTRLFVGSEGTLGVITEVALKLYGVPAAISAAVVSFTDIEGAANAVIRTIQFGVPVARIELLDEVQMDAVNRYSDLDYPVQPTLFMEFHGTEAGVKEQAELVGTIVSEFGGGGFQWETEAEARSKLWQARHDAYYAAQAMSPGRKGWPTDVCVPISRLAECIIETKKDLQESFLTAPILGHAGDGNFHVVFLINPDDTEEVAEAERLNERLVMRALALDGTCTGEHGVGLGKMKYLRAEHGDAIDLMRAIKRTIDPQNIMNPGKVVNS